MLMGVTRRTPPVRFRLREKGYAGTGVRSVTNPPGILPAILVPREAKMKWWGSMVAGFQVMLRCGVFDLQHYKE